MWFVVKNEVKWLLKNPLYYIGIVIVFVSIYNNCSVYFSINYFEKDAIIEDSNKTIGDVDFYDGYLPASEEEQYQQGLLILEDILLNEFHLDSTTVESDLQTIKDQNMTPMEIQKLMSEKYNFLNAQTSFFQAAMKKGTVDELNDYLSTCLEKENYTSYFARKYSDYLGVLIAMYSIVLLAFICINDYKKDMHELLHTKPIKSSKYILGKIVGGVFAIMIAVSVITVVFDIIVCIIGNSHGFSINFFDIWYTTIIFNLPIVCYICSAYVFIASIFKTPFSAIPLLLLQLLYSNLGSVNANGIYGYMLKPFAILVRFPEAFFSTKISSIAYINQGLLMIIAIIFACGGIYQWQRRKLI